MPLNTSRDEAIALLERLYPNPLDNDDSEALTKALSQDEERAELDYYVVVPKLQYFSCIRSLKNITIFLVLVLLPSFLRSWISTDVADRPRKLHKTSYLDGFRGVAALLVASHHFTGQWYPELQSGYNSADAKAIIFQLPFFRIVASGNGMVSAFFVISGFALSYRPLELVHDGRFPEFLDCLASAVFRRGLRLYLPVVAVTFLIMLDAQSGSAWYVGPVEPTFEAQVRHWWRTVLDITYPYMGLDLHALYIPPYNAPLWTIPYEFRGSMVVFTTLLVFCRTKTMVRVSLLFAISVYTMAHHNWDIFLFLCGTLLADLHFIRTKFEFQDTLHLTTDLSMSDAKHSVISNSWRFLQYYFPTKLSLILMFAFWLHVLCWPTEGYASSIGYEILTTWTPASFVMGENLGFGTGTQRFWLSIAAVILVFLIDCSPMLQSMFTSRFALYLGNISFALYMVHVPIILHLGRWLQAQEWPGGNGCAFWLTALILLPFVFWTSDVVWRLVDAKSALFTKWLYSKCRVA